VSIRVTSARLTGRGATSGPTTTAGTIDITGGDGSYTDVRGTGRFRATNILIGTRTDDGCSFVGVAPLQVARFDATLTGTGDA
jgi:hypothetical protein